MLGGTAAIVADRRCREIITVCLLGRAVAMVNDRNNRPRADWLSAAGSDPDTPAS
jgi:hypothetical protein